MKTRVFTSGLLLNKGRVLILRRKKNDERNPGKWDCVGGHFLSGETGEECIIREAREESGLDVRVVRAGRAFEFVDSYGRAVGLPYLLSGESDRVVLSEHDKAVWARPSVVSGYDCVPEVGILMDLFSLSGRSPKKPLRIGTSPP